MLVSGCVPIDVFKEKMTTDSTKLSIALGSSVNGIYYVSDTKIHWSSGDTAYVYGVKLNDTV